MFLGFVAGTSFLPDMATVGHLLRFQRVLFDTNGVDRRLFGRFSLNILGVFALEDIIHHLLTESLFDLQTDRM